MKSKDVIFKHLREVGYDDEARIKICGYLTGVGIKENEEGIVIAKGENTFADFLEWGKKEDLVSFFEGMLSSCKKSSKCQYCKEKREEPKFKVGDWVRATDCGCTYCTHQKAFIAMGFLNTSQNEAVKNGCVGKVFNMYYCDFRKRWLFGIQFGNKQCVMDDRGIEVYYPKAGEFFHIRLNNGTEAIGIKDYIIDSCEGGVLHTSMSYWKQSQGTYINGYLCYMIEVISELRPATESEIQLLKDKVKEKYNLEWNGKELVDIKKSDKELFEEWKKENVSNTRILQQYSIGLDYKEKKLVAYTELYLFAQWVNQFYEEEGRIFKLAFGLFSIDELRIWVDSRDQHSGSIHFNSKQAAQRAIDCLGEDLIKTALK